MTPLVFGRETWTRGEAQDQIAATVEEVWVVWAVDEDSPDPLGWSPADGAPPLCQIARHRRDANGIWNPAGETHIGVLPEQLAQWQARVEDRIRRVLEEPLQDDVLITWLDAMGRWLLVQQTTQTPPWIMWETFAPVLERRMDRIAGAIRALSIDGQLGFVPMRAYSGRLQAFAWEPSPVDLLRGNPSNGHFDVYEERMPSKDTTTEEVRAWLGSAANACHRRAQHFQIQGRDWDASWFYAKAEAYRFAAIQLGWSADPLPNEGRPHGSL